MDPTNANAVAGPSRLPAHGVEPTPPPPAPVPAPTAPDTTSTTTTTAAAAAEPENSSSSSRGPKIVPTVLDPDGLRVVPNLFELCQVDDLISLIASMLDRLIQHNDRIPLTPSSLTRFHSRAPPSINVKDYLVRIARYTNVEPCCLLILLPYVDKVCARMTTFTISSLTVHRFIITGVSVGSKALSDSFCTNGRYARVGGVSIAEMNLLEKELCEAIDWRLTTTGTVLAHYYTSLQLPPRYGQARLRRRRAPRT
ncbi:BQ2448_6148 [Microbotryum intermedium]|uniref:BQ2448_6148 protein n=1 Tax=Microbotryum intermedium TaxID=269621 RepID=A0A238FR80_9BASI|nr:BQ2448_6148 [Microbotryum intermedium]